MIFAGHVIVGGVTSPGPTSLKAEVADPVMMAAMATAASTVLVFLILVPFHGGGRKRTLRLTRFV